MSYQQKQIEKVAKDTERRLANHKVTVMLDSDLYRHYICKQPRTNFDGFEVVTWPGSLCYSGDMGTYVFERTDDMIAFFRGSAMSFSYVAEKCVSVCATDGLKEFNQAILDEECEDLLRYARENGEDNIEELEEKIAELKDIEGDPYMAISESGLWDGCDFPLCQAYTWRFLFCCYALKWMIGKIDKGEVQ